MDNMLIELKNALTKKFLNIDIHNYSHGDFEELFRLIEKLVNKSSIIYSYDITTTSISNEYIHIIAKEIDPQRSLDNTLSILLSVQDFIITDIEVSLLSWFLEFKGY